MPRARLHAFSALVALAVATAACGARATSPEAPAAVATATDVVAAGKAVLEQYRQGFEVRSVEALAPLYEHSDALVVVHQGQRQIGWSVVEPRLVTTVQGATDIRIAVAEVSVVGLGADAAVVQATLRRSISDGVTTLEDAGPITLVLRKSRARWLIVAEHYSFAPT